MKRPNRLLVLLLIVLLVFILYLSVRTGFVPLPFSH